MTKTESPTDLEIEPHHLHRWVQQIERHENDARDSNRAKSSIYKDVRLHGYNVGALKEVVRRLRSDPAERQSFDKDVVRYMEALSGVAKTGTMIATRARARSPTSAKPDEMKATSSSGNGEEVRPASSSAKAKEVQAAVTAAKTGEVEAVKTNEHMREGKSATASVAGTVKVRPSPSAKGEGKPAAATRNIGAATSSEEAPGNIAAAEVEVKALNQPASERTQVTTAVAARDGVSDFDPLAIPAFMVRT